MGKRVIRRKSPEKNKEIEIRPVPLYSILVCGLIIMIAGLYLFIKENNAYGISLPGKYGEGGGNSIILNGISTIVIRLLICLFPAYQLIKQKKRKT